MRHNSVILAPGRRSERLQWCYWELAVDTKDAKHTDKSGLVPRSASLSQYCSGCASLDRKSILNHPSSAPGCWSLSQRTGGRGGGGGVKPRTSRQFIAEPRVNKQQLAVKTTDKLWFTTASSGWREPAGCTRTLRGGIQHTPPQKGL